MPASLCLVATLVMVSPYQGKVNGILTLAGQQAKKPEYDKKKTPLPLHAVLCAWRGRSLYGSGATLLFCESLDVRVAIRPAVYTR